MTAPVNQFERAGRSAKVLRLLVGLDAIVRDIMPGADDARIAAWLVAMPREDRARIAVLSGVKMPSDTTWDALVAAVRERKEIGDRFGDEKDVPIT